MSGYTVRTAPRPAGEGWRKVPSVTYGGAPFFWHRRTADGLEWLAYDRIAHEWRLTVETFRCRDCGASLALTSSHPDTGQCHRCWMAERVSPMA